MCSLSKSDPKINIAGEILLDEPMAGHTTFKVGGPADIFAIPAGADDLATLLAFAKTRSMPCFVLGGGANVLVADAGIRGMVISMSRFDSITHETLDDGSTLAVIGAGLPISTASGWAADHGLGGLEFIYSMPGSVAGAVWMNARCYGSDIYSVLAHAETISPDGIVSRYQPDPDEFSYKRSPFQVSDTVITSVGFTLHAADSEMLWTTMIEHEKDRAAKGHFAAPCAGSVFKNNRSFGKPTGALIDELGLRGFQTGGARISDLHANIITNTGNATAADILSVADHMAREVQEKFGFALEREVLVVGDWGDQ